MLQLLGCNYAEGLRLPWVSKISQSQMDTCQCACCYQVGGFMHSECVSPSYTSFDVATCAECNVSACAYRFPVSCGEPTSEINTSCIVRHGWLLCIVPVTFIIISVGLIIYGCFFKKYDGYHPVTRPEPLQARKPYSQYQATGNVELRTWSLFPCNQHSRDELDSILLCSAYKIEVAFFSHYMVNETPLSPSWKHISELGSLISRRFLKTTFERLWAHSVFRFVAGIRLNFEV